MDAARGSAGFVFARARAHRPLLAAALLTVLLTTAVLATLAAYSTTIGDAALRHALTAPRDAADTTLLVKAEALPEGGHAAADTAVREGAERAFDGLPVTLRTLARSGPYALPLSLRTADERAESDEPALTHFAALDRTQVRITEGRMPTVRAAGPEMEAALPVDAARELKLRPGARLTLGNRLEGPPARVRITGLYRPIDASASYWQLDDLNGRGIVKVDFTTYGPLLADASVVTGNRVSPGPVGWLASADFSEATTGRIETLRSAMAENIATLPAAPAMHGSATATSELPATLDRIERSLFVSRSTLLVVALQLTLLAAAALLLVARLLTAERTSETRLLRARGASRARVARLAALEALLLAVPAAVCAPLLAGPLTRLLAGRGALARIGLHLDASVGTVAGQGVVWLVSVGVALGCALAVTLPALATPYGPGRAKPLPGAVRAGADVGLLVVAGVAYWQLSRRSGAAGEDLGMDPLLVVAPALALLAGTVLTLRLLPPLARLAERRAARGRGLPGALAGWQLSRRPMRGAGPVLLMVLAVALGMLAIGQGSSWQRSQDDQADFRAGAPVRVLSSGADGPGRGTSYASLPGVRTATPAFRTAVPLSGGRTATVLALDTTEAGDTLLMRSDLSAVPVRTAMTGLAPKGAVAGVRVPAGTARLVLTAALRGADVRTTVDVSATVEDSHGIPFTLQFGGLRPDERPHDLVVDVPMTAGGSTGPLALTGFQVNLPQPAGKAGRHRLSLTALTATDTAGRERALPLSGHWQPSARADDMVSPEEVGDELQPRMVAGAPATVDFRTGSGPSDMTPLSSTFTIDLRLPRPSVSVINGVATDRFLASTGAQVGQRLNVAINGATVPVRLARSVHMMPTTAVGGPEDGGALLLDLRSVNHALQARQAGRAMPNEWWLEAGPGKSVEVAAALRGRPDIDPSRVVVRDEIAAELRDDPFGAGPGNAFAAAALAAAALTAVGFAVSAAGALRDRSAEFAVLRALGASRRRLARVVLIEYGVLVGMALAVGVLLGAVLARAVIPLVTLTAQATRPLPEALVVLPPLRVAALLSAVSAVPLLVTAVLALRRADPVSSLRDRGGE